MFNSACANGALKIRQNENRRGLDIFLARMTALKHSTPFTLSATITSRKANSSAMDENQYGFFILDASGMEYALRFQGQYFNMESWDDNEEGKAFERYNMSYFPFLNTNGQANLVQFSCTDEICDLYLNHEFSARFPLDLRGGISGVGIFAASTWDERFGEVTIQDLTIQPSADAPLLSEPYALEDDLTADHGTFSQSGLSGAFNIFAEDGFHFSSLIPFGYYAAKTNPSLADVAVSTTVHMEIDPTGSSSRYAGLICRSSQDGMYMAVIRADGSYSIFRDTSQRPFALLAERKSDAILSGISENLLKLECIGDQVNFYINGTQVEALTDHRYGLQFGRSGLFTKTGGEPSADAIIFKDFVIEEIRDRKN